MPGLRSLWRPAAAAVAIVTVGLGAAIALPGLVGNGPEEPAGPPVAAAPAAGAGRTVASGDSLQSAITALQDRLRRLPEDYAAWADLGLAYVQQAANTVDPSYYAKAEGALERSLSIQRQDNFKAMTGMSALAAARHDFGEALSWAEKATDVNPHNAEAWGAKGDALLQLGRYDAAFRAIQRENDLRPGFAAFARASYAWELRGDIDQAGQIMQLALDDANLPTEKAFAHYYLGELDFNAGRPQAALEHYRAGLEVYSSYAALDQGVAKAQWALGDEDAALRGYEDLVRRVPSPGYVLEYAELLEAAGKTREAQQQYDLFTTTVELFESNGVELDVSSILFFANHGDPEKALTVAQEVVEKRPFVEVYDALAWALHQNGKDEQALVASKKAMELGTQNARFFAHAGLIEKALGQDAAARRDLARALEINPWFSPLLAPRVEDALEELGGAAS